MEKEIVSKKKGFTEFLSGNAAKKRAGEDRDNGVYVARPESCGDIEPLILGLKRGEGFLVDFYGRELSEAQRMLDLLSGASFALDGKIERIMDRMYLVIPKGIKMNVDMEKNTYDKK